MKKILVILLVVILLAVSVWLVLSVSNTPQVTDSGSPDSPNRTEAEAPTEENTDPRAEALERAKKQAQKMLAERYSLPNLIKTVREEADDSKVLIALKHIRSKHPGEEAEKVYTSLIDDNQLPIRKRAFAINALGELKTPSAEDKLKKIAADKSNRLLALTAIGALSKCGDEEIIEFLKDLSNKSDSPEIRRKCAWSIKQIEASLQGR